MALPSSGQISLSDIQTEFGGSNPIALSEYYGDGNAPASGEIQLAADFYGTSAAPDGLSASSPGESADQLKIDNGYTTNGLYWIDINGTATQIYCDMDGTITGGSGGWMLFSSWGTATYSNGINDDGSLYSQMNSNGWSSNRSFGGDFSDYVRWWRADADVGYLQRSSWGTYVNNTCTKLRTKWGNVHSVGTAKLYVAGTTIATRGAGSVGINEVSTTFSSNPTFKIDEQNGIAALHWIFVQ